MVRLAGAKTVSFQLNAPQAKRVSLAGSFNNWDAKSLLAKRDSKGSWSARVSLKPGRYEYKFVVDGNWINDSRCHSCVTNAFGTQNCVVEVK